MMSLLKENQLNHIFFINVLPLGADSEIWMALAIQNLSAEAQVPRPQT